MASKNGRLKGLKWSKETGSPGASTSTLPTVKNEKGLRDFEHPQGLDVVHDDPEAALDIVAVHGLNGHREKTWTADNGVNWLRDLLPKDLHHVRVMTWGYDANTHDPKRVSCHYLYEHASELVGDLTRKRKLTQSTERPIIFVAHSLGGIVVKSALIHSDLSRQGALPERRAVKVSTYGIIYMGTPHQGGNGVQLGTVLLNVASIFVRTNDGILKHLEKDSEWLQQQLSQYNPISRDFVTKFAYETYETPTALRHKILVVPKASAVVPGQADAEPIAIPADHRNMVKFTSNSDGGYVKVSETLQIMADGAEHGIRSRWETETRRNAPCPDTSQTRERPCYIPLLRNRRFIGRKGVLGKLGETLFGDRNCRKFALAGLGGTGKTQVALEFAYWAKEKHPDYSIFWVPVLSEDIFGQTYTEIARLLDVKTQTHDENLKDNLRQYLESEKAGKWLMVLDNADDTNIIGKQSSIGRYLPSSEDGLILVTTRSRDVAVRHSGPDVVELTEMDPDEASDFLKDSLIEEYRPLLDDEDMRQEVFQELTYLPLAIAQAAAYLNTTHVPLRKYLERLKSTEQSLIRLMSKDFHDDRRYSDSQNAVAKTWLVSFDQIRESSSIAAEILGYISCIERQAIPQSILPGSPEEIEDAIELLCCYAFLVRQGDDNDDVFNMHRLVHIAIRVWLQEHNEVFETENKALRHLSDILLQSTHDFRSVVGTRSVWRPYLPHALRAVRITTPRKSEARAMLCNQMGHCLSIDAQWKEAIMVWEETHQTMRQHLHVNDDVRLTLEQHLAVAYTRDHRAKEAVELLEHVVAIRKATLAKDDSSTLSSQRDLTVAYISNGRTDKALQLMIELKIEHQVAIGESIPAEDYARLASEYPFGAPCMEDHKIKGRVDFMKHMTAVQEHLSAEADRLGLPSNSNLLHLIFIIFGKIDGRIHEKIIDILEDSVGFYRRNLAEDHPFRMESQFQLAQAYLRSDRIEEAITLLEHVLAVDKKSSNMPEGDRKSARHLLEEARKESQAKRK